MPSCWSSIFRVFHEHGVPSEETSRTQILLQHSAQRSPSKAGPPRSGFCQSHENVVVGNGYMASALVTTINKVWSFPLGHAKSCGVSLQTACKETTEVSQGSRKSLSFVTITTPEQLRNPSLSNALIYVTLKIRFKR